MKTPYRSRLVLTLAICACLVGGVAAQSVERPPASLTASVFRDIAGRQNPTVVSITTRSRVRSWSQEEEEVFRLLGVKPPPPGERVHQGVASGFIISAAGEILTSNHVVEGADAIDVALFGDERRRYRAFAVGVDPLTDTALIRLENPPHGLPFAVLGDSSALAAGDFVMAIGNPFHLSHTVTVGVVSFERRRVQVHDGDWQDMIQTDVSINPGNSGGPLFDAQGEVVGINVAILDTEDGSNGIGFAVPINAVKTFLPQLRNGRVMRGQLGVRFHEGSILEDEARALGLPEPRGALVMSVDRAVPGAHSGLRAGDVIVELGGHTVADTHDVLARASTATPGTRVKVKFFRDGKAETCTMLIEELADETEPRVPPGLPNRDGGLTLGIIAPSRPGQPDMPHGIDGALVVKVAPGSAADQATLRAGDIIRAINRHPVQSLSDAKAELDAVEGYQPIFLLVWRRGKELFLEMRRD